MKLINLILLTIFIFTSACNLEQSDINPDSKLVRLARLEIHPTHLKEYKIYLNEEIEASLALEPGVLTLYAMFEKNRPNHLTILEIYQDSTAYQAHLKTPHFLKYKNGTTHMVKSLELIECTPLNPNVMVSMK